MFFSCFKYVKADKFFNNVNDELNKIYYKIKNNLNQYFHTLRMFDEQYEKKLKSCVRVMIDNADVDSLQAESICSCLLNNLFLIDSNFVKMPDDSLTLLLDINRHYCPIKI